MEELEMPNNANTSGQGSKAPVPKLAANKFNWGAFFLTWIWGLYHKKYLTLIVLLILPVTILLHKFTPQLDVKVLSCLGFFFSLYFGIKGNTWAWQGRHYDSINQFHASQRKWAIWGLIITFVLPIAITIMLSLIFILLVSKSKGM